MDRFTLNKYLFINRKDENVLFDFKEGFLH